jgi:hydroxymethylbilane synthase
VQADNNLYQVGTRGSKLAVSQTELLLSWIKERKPQAQFNIKTIKTSGDLGLLQELGAWVKEVEIALRNGDIDLAVHSYKDMPTALPEGLVVASVPKRGAHQDCLITLGKKLHELPSGARIGTSSLRRVYQLKKLRPDVEVVPLHGNIISRMEKVEKGELDGIILALAGLQRVEMEDRATQVFSTEEFLPAVAQGALAVEIRSDDRRTHEVVSSINDMATVQAVEAERAFLMALGGGCRMPMAAFAEVSDGKLTLDGLYYTQDGSKMVRQQITGSPEEAARLGAELGKELLRKLNE